MATAEETPEGRALLRQYKSIIHDVNPKFIAHELLARNLASQEQFERWSNIARTDNWRDRVDATTEMAQNLFDRILEKSNYVPEKKSAATVLELFIEILRNSYPWLAEAIHQEYLTEQRICFDAITSRARRASQPQEPAIFSFSSLAAISTTESVSLPHVFADPPAQVTRGNSNP